MYNKSNLIVFFVFALFIIIGTNIYDDYGISWDEHNERISGFVSLNFIREILIIFLGLFILKML